MVKSRCCELLLARKASLELNSSDLGRMERCEPLVSSRFDEVVELAVTEPLYLSSKTFLSSLRRFVSNLVQ